MKRLFVALSLGMAVLYLVLAVAAAGCLAPNATPESHPGHHHQNHASHVAHSAVCAWACQANPTVGAIMDAPQAAGFLFFVGVTLVTTTLRPCLSARVPESRGPPSASSI
jgi:hypothetical protein